MWRRGEGGGAGVLLLQSSSDVPCGVLLVFDKGGRVLLPGGGGRIGDIGFPRGGVVPPRDLRGLSRGGVGLTP